jgi:subtilisin-like proprotein convertase family protein
MLYAARQMRAGRGRLFLALGLLMVTGLLLAPGGVRSQRPVTKEQMHEQMIAIAAQMVQLRHDGKATAAIDDLERRYRVLSDRLGGDDPGGVLGGRDVGGPRPAAGAAGRGAEPTPPLGCSWINTLYGYAPNAAISDLTTTSETINVSALNPQLWKLQLQTVITHTYAADLDITLTSPEGTVMTVSTDNGGPNDDVFNGTWWNDDAGDTNPPGPVTDTVFVDGVVETTLVPEEALGAFLFENPNGPWTLEIYDDTNGDTGTLVSWTLYITSMQPVSSARTFGFANETPVPITDLATASMTVEISGLNAPLCQLVVDTEITHTFADGLDITVTSPAGTVVTLTTDNGFDADDVFSETRWYDDSGENNPPGAVTDTVFEDGVVEYFLAPEEAMAAFHGESPNGLWTLEVYDDANGDTGSLNLFRVQGSICTCTCPGPGDCYGAHGTPGCEDLSCCLDVCVINPACCELEWDAGCAALAECACNPVYNDDCLDAFVALDGQVIPFDTTCATTDGPVLPAACDEGHGPSLVNDLWFRHTASCDGQATVSLCGSAYDTRLAVYTTEACPGELVACNDDACGLQSEVTFPVTAGSEHYIRVGGFSGGGTGTLTVSCQPVSSCPWDCDDHDGTVGVVDFLELLAQWGQVGTSCDIDGGGAGITDFLSMLAHWGSCP